MSNELNNNIKDYFDFTVLVNSMDDDSILKIEENLRKLLNALNKIEYYGKFYYILRELVENAERANAKRVYADRKKIPVSKLKDDKELESFIKNYHEDLNSFREELRQRKLFIRIELKVRNNIIIIRVTNNAEISSEEKTRIDKKIEKSFQIKNMREAIKFLKDKKESSGLGIVSVILALKHIGGKFDAIQYYTHFPGHTIVQINLPVYVITDEYIRRIANEVQDTISNIPKIPENLQRLLNVLNKPNVEFSYVAKLIKNDPGLSIDILKTVNSGLYMLPNRVGNINQAVSLIGIKGIKSIVSTTASREVFKSRKDIDNIWKHSYLCARYNQVLAKLFNYNHIVDDLVLCGFLHDIGKIILLGDAGINKIEQYLKNSRFNKQNTKIEEIFFVLNHALVGSEISKQWGLSEKIIEAVNFHHEPNKCSLESQPYVYITYLSNVFIGITNKRYNIAEIPIYVMRFFDCEKLEDLENLRTKVEDLLHKSLRDINNK